MISSISISVLLYVYVTIINLISVAEIWVAVALRSCVSISKYIYKTYKAYLLHKYYYYTGRWAQLKSPEGCII